MHRCSSSQGNMVGPCSCDMFHYHHDQYQHHHSHSYSSISSSSSPPSPFSMLFSKPYDIDHDDHHDQHDHDHQSSLYSFGINSGVDCTLSLGTPSTRLCSNDDVYNKNSNNYDVEVKRSSSRSDQRRSVSNFCWDLLQPKHYSAQTTSSQHKNGPRGGANNNNNNGNNNDPLVARRCANCDTTSTPLWRNGPRGPKSLCNACGIRFKKEERRASAAAATPAPSDHSPASHVYGHQYQYHQSQNNINPWNNVTHYSQPQKVFSATNELRFMESSAEDDVVSAETGISFLSWRLNVSADRPSLVHDFTR